MFRDGADVTRSSCSPAAKTTDPFLGWEGCRVGSWWREEEGTGQAGCRRGGGGGRGEAATS